MPPHNREEIVRLARSTLGTRWLHQGRNPESGLDCAGLIIWVGWEAGYLPRDFDVRGYRREPDGRTLLEALTTHARPRAWADWQPGDFVLLRDLTTIWPCHLGFLAEREGCAEPNLIHCWARQHRRCVEVRFDPDWMSRLVNLYSFSGLS